MVKCWCSSVFGFTAQLGFFGEAVSVVFNLVVESLERLLHGGNAFLELVALLEEQGLAGRRWCCRPVGTEPHIR